MIEQLNTIFRELFLDDTLTLTESTTADDIDGWDSFTHLNVIMSIESHFGISITDEEIPTLKNIGDMVSLIEKKLSGISPGISA
jgi:acyl carrier protein